MGCVESIEKRILLIEERVK